MSKVRYLVAHLGLVVEVVATLPLAVASRNLFQGDVWDVQPQIRIALLHMEP